MEKLNDSQAKEIVQTEVIIDADELQSQITSLQANIDEKVSSRDATVDKYNDDIARLEIQIADKKAKLAELKEIGVEPAVVVADADVEPMSGIKV